MSSKTRSMLVLTATMLIFGTVGIFRRFIPLPSAMIACFRGAAGAIFLIILTKIQKRKLFHKIGAKKVFGLILTGVIIGFNWIFLFEAYSYTTVATASLCYYMQPTIVVLLSPLLFHERITRKKGICALISIVGMLFVSGMLENGIPTLAEARGILFGLTAAAFYAAVVILNKKLPGIDTYEKTVIQLASAAIVLLPYILLSGQTVNEPITPFVVIMLLIIGFVHTGMAYALYFGSMDHLSAQTVAVFGYLDPVSAMILSAILLRESMTVLGMIGAIMIISAAVASEVRLKAYGSPDVCRNEKSKSLEE